MNWEEIPLRDIHLPPPVSWWPLAPGWWVLLGLVITTLVAAAAWWWHRRRRRISRAALAELSRIADEHAADRDLRRLAQRLSRLVRRVALAMGERRDVAGATGDHWRQHLDRLNPEFMLDDATKAVVTDLQYRDQVQFDERHCLQHLGEWFRHLPAADARR